MATHGADDSSAPTYDDLIQFLITMHPDRRLTWAWTEDDREIAWIDKYDEYSEITILPVWKLAAMYSYCQTNREEMDTYYDDGSPLEIYERWDFALNYAHGCDEADWPIRSDVIALRS